MERSQIQQRLISERRTYVEQVERINETGLGGLSHGDQLQEDSTVDNHPADLGSEMFEREKDLGLRSNALRRIREIDEAMQRLQSGQYGICTQCGEQIDPARLQAAPSAATCLRCQQEQEALPDRHKRPIEEEVLSPPFGRSFRDGSGDPGYDGEDTWQDVGRYGTSEGPQDLPGSVRYTEMYGDGDEIFRVADEMDFIVDEAGEPLRPPGHEDAVPPPL